MSLKGKTAAITGASRGIGREIALTFAKNGAKVAVGYKANRQKAEEVANEIRQFGGEALVAEVDVSTSKSSRAFIEKTSEEFGRLDVLVNNAGIARDNLLAFMSDDEMETVVAANLLGTMYCSRAAVEIMLPQRSGCIINISSVAATKPGRGQSNYAASKGGVEAFTKALAVELAPANIFVNAVAPGVIETDMSKDLVQFGKKEIMDRLLVKELGNCCDIARAALFLASGDNRYMTGEVLHVNGGLKMA